VSTRATLDCPITVIACKSREKKKGLAAPAVLPNFLKGLLSIEVRYTIERKYKMGHGYILSDP